MRAQTILARFRRSDAGVSALEFAMVLPVVLVLLLAGAQVVLYINATRKVQQVATAISEMLTQAAPAHVNDPSATVTAADLGFAYDSALVIFPYVMTTASQRGIAWRQAITVSFASVSFTKLSTACDGQADQSACYVASVDWTSTGTSADAYRPCLIPQLPVPDSARYSRTTLPRSLYGSGSVIAVDVTFTFMPTFGSGLVAPVTFTRSAFVQPRYASRIGFDASNTDGIATTCPGISS